MDSQNVNNCQFVINMLLGFSSAGCEFLAKFKPEGYQPSKRARKTVPQSKKNESPSLENENQHDSEYEQKKEQEDDIEERENSEDEDGEGDGEGGGEEGGKRDGEEGGEEGGEGGGKGGEQDAGKISFNKLLLLNKETNHLLTD